jgi:hypothetical protein
VGEEAAAVRVDRAVEAHLANHRSRELSTTAVGDLIAAYL